jgi:uncharacterized BrkB/YihY/UPF0761 family membrane protein
MEKRYRVLRFIAGLYQVLGVLVPILALVSVFVIQNNFQTGLTADRSNLLLNQLLVVFLPALISGIFLFGFGQLIMVLIHIEENTRRTSLLLGRRSNRS